MEKLKKLLVLGVGNILMMDEGIGVHAIYEFWKEKENYDENLVDFIDGGTFTQDIFYLFEKYETLLVLDIVRAGKKPGTIYRLLEDELRRDKNQPLSLHDIDLLDSLDMTAMAGHKPELIVLGIEPEKIDWDTELTPTLKKHFLRLCRLQGMKSKVSWSKLKQNTICASLRRPNPLRPVHLALASLDISTSSKISCTKQQNSGKYTLKHLLFLTFRSFKNL